jgi:hypothetical protein
LVREALFAAQVLASAGAVARTLAFGAAMPPPAETAGLSADLQKRVDEYRERERAFRSALAPPRGGSAEELQLYQSRVRVERVIFSLFDRKDASKVAAGFALDVDLDREAPFIDELLRNLPVPWLAPYLNLVAGHRKLCAGAIDDARGQLARARDGGHPLIRVAAEYLLNSPIQELANSPTTSVPLCSPSP